VCPKGGSAALLGHWQAARQRLELDGGSPLPNPGLPEILGIPPGHEARLAAVEASPRFAFTVGEFPWEFKLIEIDPLLAFQFHINTGRGDALWNEAGASVDLAALLRLCLPVEVLQIAEGADFQTRPDP